MTAPQDAGLLPGCQSFGILPKEDEKLLMGTQLVYIHLLTSQHPFISHIKEFQEEIQTVVQGLRKATELVCTLTSLAEAWLG